MDVTKDRQIVSVGDRRDSRHLESIEAQQMLDLGRRQGWDFALLGSAPMPEEPISLEGWKIVPAEEDTSPVPKRSLERIDTIYSSGLRPKGFVVVHEAPALLPANASDASGTIRVSTLDPRIKRSIRTMSVAAGSAVLGLAILPGLLAAALSVLIGVAALAVPLVFVGGLAVIDPILVAVTEDGSWVEIDRWWTEE